jgi:cell division protein FtsZ
LSGARGVLVNITASSTVKMREVNEVMITIQGFSADEATVIVGQVIDEGMEDRLRVTMVATGLGSPVRQQQTKPMQVVRTGTYDAPMTAQAEDVMPNVIRGRRERAVQAMVASGVDMLDIPAFLRKQAD